MNDRLNTLRRLLGPAHSYMLRPLDKPLLKEWAGLSGFDPYDMSAVELANLYHAHGSPQSPTDAQRIAAEAICATMKALGAGNGLTADQVREICQAEIAAAPARRLEIVTAHAIVTLDGPLHYRTPIILRAVGRGDAVMMVGPAGCGKTTIGEHVARALNLPFYITSTINDTHELMGFKDGYGGYHATAFRRAYEHGGVWIADEIDAWDATALLTANSALANGFATFPDLEEPLRRHPDFRMVATANTFGSGADRVYIGRNELDAASLDRFAVINVDYDLTLERMFAAGQDRWLDHVWNVRRIVQEKRIRHVVSSRAISRGALALASGEDWDDVEEMYLFKGMSETDRDRITDAE